MTATTLPASLARALEPGEWVVATARLHWSVHVPAFAISWLWGALLVWAAFTGLWLVALLAIAVEVVFVPALFIWALGRRRTSLAAVTSRRLVMVTGPLPLTARAIALREINAVHVRRSWLGGMAGAWSLYVTPLDPNGEALRMDDLADAEAFAKAVRKAARAD